MIKVLSHFAHGTYQTELSKIPDVEFYHVVDSKGIFPDDTRPKKAWGDGLPQPANIHRIEAADVDPKQFNVLLIHWHPFIDLFCDRWNSIPAIFLEHTWPKNNLQSEKDYWGKFKHHYLKHTVYITPSSLRAWDDEVGKRASYIYHSIPIDNFPQKTHYDSTGDIITLTNEFIKRDWACGFQLWSKVLELPNSKTFDNVALYGYGNENLGKQFNRGPLDKECVYTELQKASVYFNPSIMSPIPMSVLEAVAIGTPLVSTAYCEIGKLFYSGIHGVITNDMSELRTGIKFILNNPDKARQMAENARKLITTIFTPKQFQDNWYKLLRKIAYGT